MKINPWVEPAAPWKSSQKNVEKSIRERIPLDAIVFGIADLDRPQLDEVLFSQGFSKNSVVDWRTVGFQRDSLLRTAQTNGSSSGLLRDTGLSGAGLAGDAIAVCELLPTSLAERRYWWATAARKNDAFSLADRETLRFLLDEWRSGLQRHHERGACTAIAGYDNRVIYADPTIRMRLQAADAPIESYLATLRDVFLQRWPDMKEDDAHDIIHEIGKDPVWVVARRRRPLEADRSEHWVYEFRPLEKGELPSNGLLPDERIARALALVHDRYYDGPSLTEMANLVHISPFHFHRLFTKQVGQSPKQYLLHKQLQIGRWRLRLGLEQIGDIAVGTGFANHAHFTSTFRRSLGMSPSEYQQKFMSGLGEELTYGAKAVPPRKKRTRRGRPAKKKAGRKKKTAARRGRKKRVSR